METDKGNYLTKIIRNHFYVSLINIIKFNLTDNIRSVNVLPTGTGETSPLLVILF